MTITHFPQSSFALVVTTHCGLLRNTKESITFGKFIVREVWMRLMKVKGAILRGSRVMKSLSGKSHDIKATAMIFVRELFCPPGEP